MDKQTVKRFSKFLIFSHPKLARAGGCNMKKVVANSDAKVGNGEMTGHPDVIQVAACTTGTVSTKEQS